MYGPLLQKYRDREKENPNYLSVSKLGLNGLDYYLQSVGKPEQPLLFLNYTPRSFRNPLMPMTIWAKPTRLPGLLKKQFPITKSHWNLTPIMKMPNGC